MTYALAIQQGEKFEVSCANCLEGIGTMDGEMLQRAIMARGAVICPSCRLRKCDFCGAVKERRLPFTGLYGPGGAARICPLCVQHKRNAGLPEYVRETIVSYGREDYPAFGGDGSSMLVYSYISPHIEGEGDGAR